MSPILTTSVASLFLVGLFMLPPLSSARALRRYERQTDDIPQPFTVDTRLFTGLDILERTTCLLNGNHQLEVGTICKVFQTMKQLEESLNVASDGDYSINETATEIKTMVCNKLQNISTALYNNLATDCSDGKVQLVCSRAPICTKAREARLSIRSTMGTLPPDQKPQWINENIEDNDVRDFISKRNLFG